MVSQRQRLARKRYKTEHPELFPKPEPTPPKDPDKKKNKTPKFKRKKPESKDPNKPVRKSFTKHPLRVPGLKPGDGCFICKGTDHIAKLCPTKSEWERNKICLLCRRRGHSLKYCPEKTDKKLDQKMCYNCGEAGHSLDKCPYPLQDGGTKFANCFICNEHGHLSKNCPKSTHGIYPKGGCCKRCGEVTHLARDCPKGFNDYTQDSRDEIERPRGKVTKLGGDDLEDDFTIEEKPLDLKASLTLDSKASTVKPKKKQASKVVNFVG